MINQVAVEPEPGDGGGRRTQILDAALDVMAEHGPLVVLSFLERYFTRQIELGQLRAHDPRAAARAFMGMLIVYAIGREIFPTIGTGFPPGDTYGKEVVAIFLTGLATA